MSSTEDSPSRRRRASLAAAAIGGVAVVAFNMLGPTETLAAFSGNLFAGTGVGLSAAEFRLQSSTMPDSGFGDHSTDEALELPGNGDQTTAEFTTPISLSPGQTTYAAAYLRTSTGTSQGMRVSVAQATTVDGFTSNSQLWNTLVTYGARAQKVESLLTPPSCDSSMFATLNLSATLLFGTPNALGSHDNLASMSSAPTSSTFTLNAAGGDTYMVCFRFSLSTGAKTATPSVNGASIYPHWVFTGVPA